MRAVKILSAWPVMVLLAASAAVPHFGPVDPIPAPLAHSAQLTLDGVSTRGALILRVRGPQGSPVDPGQVTVAVDGKELPANPRADGTLYVPLPAGTTAAVVQLDVTITHDGIRELLSARLPVEAGAPAEAAQPGGSGVHSQLLWWALNIAIVFIAVLVLSRRMG